MSKQLFRDVDGAVLTPQGSVVCIGAFDGIHRGHQALLERARVRAAALGVAAAVVSFEPLPRQHFAGRAEVARLTSPRQRLALLRPYAQCLGLLRFNARLASVTAQDFVERVLVTRLRAREVWVGPGFRFGARRQGDIALLQALGAEHGFAAHEIAPVAARGERISSSRIRAALASSAFDDAAQWLGRRFTMCGHVVRGQQLGRRLGYPTANLRIPHGRAPVMGVFAVRVSGAGLRDWPAVASLGTRPTINGVEPLLESHLFDFDGDLYGKVLDVEFVAKLRDEARFADLDAMVAQIHRDARQAREMLSAACAAAGA
jgi:riboflavin kinase/FMN adenylyltransferase